MYCVELYFILKETIKKLSSDSLRNGSSLGGTQMNKIKQEKI